MGGEQLGIYRIDEHQNPPYPFNVAPTKSEDGLSLRSEDFQLKLSMTAQVKGGAVFAPSLAPAGYVLLT
jgi:hypothetical protein